MVRVAVRAALSRLHQLLEQLGIAHLMSSHPYDLSGGELQKASLACLLVRKPEVLLLDEPTAALDPKSSETIMKIADDVIRTLQLTAILVTHNMSYAVKYGTRLIMMDLGKIGRDLSKAEKEKLTVSDLYRLFI